VAALIKDGLGVEAAVVEGARGEFSVRADGRIVAQKSSRGFPDDEAIVAAVRTALSDLPNP
jgi:hypothetical protein